MAALRSGGAYVADFSTSLPAGWTFSRTGTRTAIQGAALAVVSSGSPAFESWLGVPRGLSINPGVTNITTQTADNTSADWATFGSVGGGVVTAGANGPNGSPSRRVQENGGSNRGQVFRRTSSIASGTRIAFSGFVRVVSGSARWGVRVIMANQDGGTAGPQATIRLDGPLGAYVIPDDSKFTGLQCDYQRISSDTVWFSLAGTVVTTGAKELLVLPVWQDSATGDLANYTADTSSAFEVSCLQCTTGGVAAPILTTTGTASVNADSCIASSPAWLNATAGAMVVEHDCQSGVLIGSGSNTVLASQGQGGVTGITWDASGALISHNGGPTTSVSTPTFASDIRLLATSAVTNSGRVKSFAAWKTKLTAAELRAATKTKRVTAAPGAWRACAARNVLPPYFMASSGTSLTHQTRFKAQILGGDVSSIKIAFPNFKFGSLGANNITIVSAALERETGVAESVPITFTGSRSVTITPGTGVESDVILPTAFTGLSVFPNEGVFWVRIRLSVTTAGHEIPISRWSSEVAGGAFMLTYDPASGGSISNIDATGVMTQSKATTISTSRGYSGIVLGTYASGDPITAMGLGDSLTEGTSVTSGAFLNKAANANGWPFLEFAAGGSKAPDVSEVAHWKPFLAYARVLLDSWDTNDVARLLHRYTIWDAFRNTYNGDKVAIIGLPPRTTSTDSWVTEGNQSIFAGRTYPGSLEYVRLSAYAMGFADYYLPNVAARGTDQTKWIVNGAANYGTGDGTHQTAATDNLMATALGTLMAGVVVT